MCPIAQALRCLPTSQRFQQVILEKQTLDVFDNPNTDAVLARIREFTDPDAEFLVFGVVTEFCVKAAAKGLLKRGRRVAIVTDAIETIKPEDGRRTLDELRAAGARLVTTGRGARSARSFGYTLRLMPRYFPKFFAKNARSRVHASAAASGR